MRTSPTRILTRVSFGQLNQRSSVAVASDREQSSCAIKDKIVHPHDNQSERVGNQLKFGESKQVALVICA